MKWFKFYGQDFITDPKIKKLTIEQQLAWIYLLSLASEKDGVIEHLDEQTLGRMMGLSPTDDNWDFFEGCFEKMEKLKMITIDNADETNDNKMITLLRYKSRQTANLSSYERVKRHREKKKSEAKNKKSDDNNDNAVKRYHDNARIDKIRKDKKEIYKEKKIAKDGNKQKYPPGDPRNSVGYEAFRMIVDMERNK